MHLAWRAWLPARAPRPWQSIALGTAFGGVAVGIRVVADTLLGGNVPFLPMFPALLLAAILGGYVGGAACLVASGIGAAIFLLPLAADTLAVHIGFWTAGALVVAVAAGMADSVRKLRLSEARLGEAQAQLRTLVGELAHRNRNALFVIMAIVRQSARNAASPAEAEKLINARLEALLRAQDLVVQGEGGTDLHRVVAVALAPFDRERFDIVGPSFQISADVAGGLALLFHELATNAVKYGALAAPQGRIVVRWAVEGQRARLDWVERGGPPLTPPSRQGFGARLFEVALKPQGGTAERRFEPEGVVCELMIPGSGSGADTVDGVIGTPFSEAAAPQAAASSAVAGVAP